MEIQREVVERDVVDREDRVRYDAVDVHNLGVSRQGEWQVDRRLDGARQVDCIEDRRTHQPDANSLQVISRPGDVDADDLQIRQIVLRRHDRDARWKLDRVVGLRRAIEAARTGPVLDDAPFVVGRAGGAGPPAGAGVRVSGRRQQTRGETEAGGQSCADSPFHEAYRRNGVPKQLTRDRYTTCADFALSCPVMPMPQGPCRSTGGRM
jgi:hypothetical protein